MWLRSISLAGVLGGFLIGVTGASEPEGSESIVADRSAADRGRIALTLTGFLKPEWSEAAYRRAGGLWDSPAPDPDRDPLAYAAAFRWRYGLHPAPYPNDGLPMGLRRGLGSDGAKTTGIQLDCLMCHGGSIGGKSYVGLGNTQLDLRAVLNELTIADGRRPPPSTFVLNSSRGTNNAGMVAAVLLSLRNPDLSFRFFPVAPGRQPARDGHPPLVAPQAQGDDVLRRTHRCPIGPHQHAVPPGREDPRPTQGPGADLP